MAKNRLIAIGLVLTVILDTVVQLLWKFCVATLPPTQALGPLLIEAARQPWFLVLLIVAVFQFVNWLLVLEHAELSYAKPIASLSYVTVCLASAYLFKESVSLLKAAGIASILAGVWLMCKSTASTPPRP